MAGQHPSADPMGPLEPPPGLSDLLDWAVGLQRLAVDAAHDDPRRLLHQGRAFGRHAFAAGVALLASGDPVERMVGCDLLAALCDPDEQGWGREVASALSQAAAGEGDPDVLWSVARALGFAEDRGGLPTLVALADHADADVRLQAARALPSCEEGADLGLLSEALMGLMGDPDEHVRDWATFGLGTLTSIDGAEVRDALVGRLEDVNLDVRDEALLGLARRRDRRAHAALAAQLAGEAVGFLAVEAAAYLADARLLDPLRALTGWWDLDPQMLDEAQAACDPQQQAREAQQQEAFMAQLEPALAGWPGAAAAISGQRLERGTSVVVEHDGQTLRYDLSALLMTRSGGDLAAAVQAVLSDLAAAEPTSTPDLAGAGRSETLDPDLPSGTATKPRP